MENKKITICSTVHPYDDPRIFHRQGRTLAEHYNVRMFICAPFTYKSDHNLEIYGLPQWQKKSDRIKNIFLLIKKLYADKADLYIFHDPELLPLIPFVKIFKQGKTIYDIHENYREMIEEKEWIPAVIRKTASAGYRIFEKIALTFTDMIWYPVKDIGRHYPDVIPEKQLLVRNIPQLGHFEKVPVNGKKTKNQFIYIGTMVEDRGIKELVDAFRLFRNKHPEYKLYLIGPFKSADYKQKVKNFIAEQNLKDWVILTGEVPYDKIPSMLKESKVGLLNFLPTPNNIHGLPNKLFEYMAVGLPVIASDFPNYREILTENDAGICADSTKPEVVAEAMEKLADNEDMRLAMGESGKRLVQTSYSWEKESQKIIKAIEGLFPND